MLRFIVVTAMGGIVFLGSTGAALANMQMQNSTQMRSSVTVMQSNNFGGGSAGGFPIGGYYGSSYQVPPTIINVIPRPQPIYVEPAPVTIEPQPVTLIVPAPAPPPVIIHERAPRKVKKPVRHRVHHVVRHPPKLICQLPTAAPAAVAPVAPVAIMPAAVPVVMPAAPPTR